MNHPLLRATSLRFSYGIQPIINDLSLSIDTGQVISLLGPNGSGKSTLIKLLLGHLHGEGDIEWDGRPIKTWTKRDLARRVAYLPQTPGYEPDQTVEDALRLGRAPYWGAFGLETHADSTIIRRVARSLNLEHFLDRRMDELSGGQRQRILLGRCLTQEPTVLLLDEPATYLDLKNQVEVYRLLQNLARTQSLTILIASHDLNLAGAYSDRLLLLNDGVLVGDGTPSDVLTAPLLTRVYGLPMERIDRSGSPIPIILPIL
jgi:ABC-type cobalamin/Fe3+-siderophores transport system ATPase subunit